MLKFALRNLLSRPLRSLLSLLGLTVAIAGMVGLFSVAEGIDQMMADTFGRISGLLAMQPGAPLPLVSKLPTDWGDEIAEVDGVGVVNAEVWQRANVIDGKMIFTPPRFLFGTDIETRLRLRDAVYRDEIVPGRGRFLAMEDRGTRRCVVSTQIAEEFGKDVGDTLRVNDYDLEIIGIYHCGSLLLDVAIILDIDQVRAITRFDASSVSAFYIEQTEGIDNQVVAERIRDVFRGRKMERWQPSSLAGFSQQGSGSLIVDFFRLLERKLLEMAEQYANSQKRQSANSVDDDDRMAQQPAEPTLAETDDAQVPMDIQTATDWAERFDRLSDDLDIFLAIMTGIGVTIAVLSIVNTMLMSVTERIIEFGILKANGWSRSDVLKLITFESAILGVVGGVSGCALGKIATAVVNWYWPTRVFLYASPGLLLFSLLFSAVLGIVGGLYPAIWAMRMMPMDAIRRG